MVQLEGCIAPRANPKDAEKGKCENIEGISAKNLQKITLGSNERTRKAVENSYEAENKSECLELKIDELKETN